MLHAKNPYKLILKFCVSQAGGITGDKKVFSCRVKWPWTYTLNVLMCKGVGLVYHRNGISWINSVVTDLWDLAPRSSEVRWTVADSLVTMHHTPSSILTQLLLASGSLTVFTWHHKILHQFLNYLILITQEFDGKRVQLQLSWYLSLLALYRAVVGMVWALFAPVRMARQCTYSKTIYFSRVPL
jgi:hypothetical protein